MILGNFGYSNQIIGGFILSFDKCKICTVLYCIFILAIFFALNCLFSVQLVEIITQRSDFRNYRHGLFSVALHWVKLESLKKNLNVCLQLGSPSLWGTCEESYSLIRTDFSPFYYRDLRRCVINVSKTLLLYLKKTEGSAWLIL